MSNTYDMLRIQSTLKPFYIILENEKDDNIRKTRNYYKYVNKVFCDLLKKYKKANVVDYNKNNCFFALTAHMNKHQTYYINKNKSYNKFVRRSCVVNDLDSIYVLNELVNRNKLLRNKKIDFLICNGLRDIYLNKRIFNKEQIENIFILQDEKTFDDIDYNIVLDMMRKGYRFYTAKPKMTMINMDNAIELLHNKNQPLICLHHTSKFFNSFIVTFD
tara:strand:+ start:1532 stop:2182 length:651 start_codon:yes stop_codon:yes gene_type:complete